MQAEKTFEALATYDFGDDREILKPIDEAIVTAHGDSAAYKELETRSAAALTNVSRDAKDFVCRKLMMIGTAASVPAWPHCCRRRTIRTWPAMPWSAIPTEAAQAVPRDALPKLAGTALAQNRRDRVARRAPRDAASVSPLAALLVDADKAIACAAASASWAISARPKPPRPWAISPKKPPEDVKPAVADASLVCTERLLAGGKKTEAILIYKSLAGEDQPKHVRLAAAHGLLVAAGKKE